MLQIKLVLSIFCVCAVVSAWADHQPCNLRKYSNGFVCVCNETYCDSMNVEKPTNVGDYLLVTSSKAGQRFEASRGQSIKAPKTKKKWFGVFNHPSVIRVERQAADYDESEVFVEAVTLTIDRNQKYQKIEGFGGAFTGAVSYLFDNLPETLRHTIYRNYYSKSDGIGYNLMRIPIGGCDFDLEPWAYLENSPNDTRLANFTVLDPRDLNRIKQLKKLKEITGNHEIKLVGAAWSPPRWMKTNNAWSGYGYLKPEYYQTWADYHFQYLRLMAAENVTYWGISTGNEPLNGVIGWIFVHFMSLGWTPENQGKFVGQHLGPLLKDSAFRDVKLFAADDQRYIYPWWFQRMQLGAKNALDFIDGLAVHWYWDAFISANLLDETYKKYPDKVILNTESCIGDKPFETHGPLLGAWSRAEKYVLAIIEDLQHYVSGWIDWNLMLDEKGGPTYVNNTVDSAIIVNMTSKTEFYKQPIFYAMAHFSKFIPPGSIRIESTVSGYKSGNIKTAAFICPDNTTTIILYNKSDKKLIVHFTDESRGSYEISLSARSVNSFIYA